MSSDSDPVLVCAQDHAKHLLDYLHALYLQGDLCDFKLTFANGAGQIVVHRVVLLANCMIFKAMAESGTRMLDAYLVTSEAQLFTSQKGADRECIVALVEFMYTGALKLTVETVSAVSRAASLWGVASAVDLCSQFKENVTAALLGAQPARVTSGNSAASEVGGHGSFSKTTDTSLELTMIPSFTCNIGADNNSNKMRKQRDKSDVWTSERENYCLQGSEIKTNGERNIPVTPVVFDSENCASFLSCKGIATASGGDLLSDCDFSAGNLVRVKVCSARIDAKKRQAEQTEHHNSKKNDVYGAFFAVEMLHRYRCHTCEKRFTYCSLLELHCKQMHGYWTLRKCKQDWRECVRGDILSQACSQRGGVISERGGANRQRGGASAKRGGASRKRGGASGKRGGASRKRGGERGGASRKRGGASGERGGASRKRSAASGEQGGARRKGSAEKGGESDNSKGDGTSRGKYHCGHMTLTHFREIHCRWCKKRFTRWRHYRLHRQSAHGAILRPLPKLNQCITCGRRFRHVANLQKHNERIHLSIRQGFRQADFFKDESSSLPLLESRCNASQSCDISHSLSVPESPRSKEEVPSRQRDSRQTDTVAPGCRKSIHVTDNTYTHTTKEDKRGPAERGTRKDGGGQSRTSSSEKRVSKKGRALKRRPRGLTQEINAERTMTNTQRKRGRPPKMNQPPCPSECVVVDPSRPRVCSHCSKTFRQKSHLNRHLKEHSGDLLTCPHAGCCKTFKESSKLRYHVQGKHDGGYQCPLVGCSKRFTDRDCMLRHKRWEHDGQRQFVCEQCGVAKFYSRQDLESHARKAHGKDKATCAVCQREYLRQRDLRLHKCLGAPPHRYACAECTGGARFDNKKALRDHVIAAHVNTFKYQCERCGMKYKWESSLRRHIQSSHKTDIMHD